MDNSLRIKKNIRRSQAIRFQFNKQTLQGFAGETIAVALLANGIRLLRQAPVDGGGRGLFCAMGICQECLVLVDGLPLEACRTSIEEGLAVSSVLYQDPPAEQDNND